jgi:glycosyltransferase involved in cell wall biosynthesis
MVMKIQLPLVSVAIISFNQKRYLKECIESTLAQDYDNVEIVVADDGSTDGSHELLRNYEMQYPLKFVLSLSLKNEGITKNSNNAHDLCSGKYISWMGGDDLMMPGKIKSQVDYMETNPNCSICYHDVIAFDSDTGETIYQFSQKYRQRSGKMRTLIKHGSFNCACSTMVRRECTPKHGFDERVPIASDWLYDVETLANGGKIYCLNKVLGKYRRHSNNITSRDAENSNRANSAMQDHFISCALLLSKYPTSILSVRYRMSCLLFSMAILNKDKYLRYLFASIASYPTKNNIGAIILYLLFLKKI